MNSNNNHVTKLSFEAISENIGDVIFYLAVEEGSKYRFVYANSAFYKITGLSPKDVIGKLATEVIPPSAHKLVIDNYQKAIQEKKTVRWEETTVYPAGIKYGEVSITPVFDSSGKCINLAGTVHDVTERKLVELALQEKNAKLETMNKIMVERENKMADLKKKMAVV